MKRVAESAQRLRAKLRAYPHYKLPLYLRSLKGAAASRRTKLLLLPRGMSKREKNQTRYNQRKKSISWTIEWRFHSTDIALLDHGVHEDTNLCSVIEKHLKPGPWNHPLRQFCEEHLESLKFFIRKYPKGPKSPFHELDIRAPLKQQLANVVILEYPVIHVFLPSHSYDLEVVKDVHPVTHSLETKDSVRYDHPSPKGVAFREEEIEEDDRSSDPQVYDAVKNVISSPLHPVSHHNMSEKELDDSSVGHLLRRAPAANCSYSASTCLEPGSFEDVEFDFDQGLMDAYSDLIAQINPDDFLDLEGEFARAEGLKDISNSRRNFSVEEELEEGEIAQ